jgi:thymidine phosphorylase
LEYVDAWQTGVADLLQNSLSRLRGDICPLKTAAIIDELLPGAAKPGVMDELITAFRQPDIADDDVARLAMRLAESGERLSFHGNRPIADIPSTGGPSSLSTLLSPLVLVIAGAIVPKLGVPGRPAGGIDVLACIPGFNPDLSPLGVRNCIDVCGYAHFLAGKFFAPLDANLFAYRRTIGAINVPPLAIASLLSKKIAAGVTHITLDVRVAPHTNFGSTWDEARENSHRFIRVARILGISATCLLTDATLPYQPFIGRGESLIALARMFSAQRTRELADHLALCTEMANFCLNTSATPHQEELKLVFRHHLEQQGTNWSNFITKIEQVESQPTAVLTAEGDGYFSVDLERVRQALVSRQEAAKLSGEQFPDPCGITLLIPSGALVNKGDPVARVRSSDNLDEALTDLRRCMMQTAHPLKQRFPEKLVATDV